MPPMLYLCAGFVLLFFGGQALVNGATRLAETVGLSRAFIGLVLVGLGTSAPELAFGIGAALTSHGDLVVGNVIGSNIVNIALALGLSLLVGTMAIDPNGTLKQIPFMLLITFLSVFFILDGHVSRLEGWALLLSGVAGLVLISVQEKRAVKNVKLANNIAESVTRSGSDTLTAEPIKHAPFYHMVSVALVLCGIGLLIAGAEALIIGAVEIASVLGVSESVISLTVTAFGTGIPEITATLIAAFRREYELALGNIVGSNVMNLTLVLGSSSIAAPLQGLQTGLLSLAALVLFSLVLALLLGFRRATRTAGVLLIVAYLGYTVLTFSS